MPTETLTKPESPRVRISGDQSARVAETSRTATNQTSADTNKIVTISEKPKISPKFQSLIFPLTPEAQAQLEANIVSDGCRDPLVVWDGILIDGHNRFDICQRHNIPFKTVEMKFADEDAAMDWIDANQLGRRNLTPDQQSVIRGRRYNRIKKTKAEAGSIGGSSRAGDKVASAKTAAVIAKQHGVSARTVIRDGKRAEALDKLEETNPEEAQAVRDGLKRFNEVRREIKLAEVKESVKLPDDQGPTTNADMPRTVPVKRIPASAIATRPESMQFKRMDDSTTGENDADKLTGPWDDFKAGNLLLWEPRNPAAYQLEPGMKYIVANGHHRYASGQSQGVKSYNAQIIREADGFSPKDAARLAAEVNIADGKGTILDQVKFIQTLMENHGKEMALKAAQRYGSPGRAAQDIVFKASAALFTSFINDQITPEATRAIANAAPNNEAAQRIGIKAAMAGRSPEFAKNLIKAVISRTRGGSPKQIDLFGKDESAMKEMEAEAKIAEGLILVIRHRVQALRSAGRRPEIAASEGIDVRNPASVEKRLKDLKAELARWDDWPLHPDLADKVRTKKPAN